MTKTLTLDVTSFKFADNETDLSFRAMQNGVIISDSTLSATIKIKQVDVGYLKSVSAKWVDKRIVISSGDLSDLPVGSYSLELWLSSSSGYEIYPDSGFVNLYINQNATGISGNLISSITLGEFQQQFSDLTKEVMDNLQKGVDGAKILKGTISVDKLLPDLKLKVENAVSYVEGVNLINKATATTGYYVSGTVGAKNPNASYQYNYLNVNAGEQFYLYYASNVHIAFFDSTGTFVSGLVSPANPFTVPANTVQMSVSYQITQKDTIVLAKKAVSQYVPYELGIDGTNINSQTIQYSALSADLVEALKATKIIKVGPGQTYTSLLKAISENTATKNTYQLINYKVDMKQEYIDKYGVNFFANYVDYSGSDFNKRGYNLKNGDNLVADAASGIYFIYDNANDNVCTWFSLLCLTMNNYVYGVDFKTSTGSCRYIIHDDFSWGSEGKNMTENCRFEGESKYHQAIGGGTGFNSIYHHKNNKYVNCGADAVTYHINSQVGAKNKIIYENLWLSDGSSLRGTWYGQSTEVTELIAYGCKADNIYIKAHTVDGTSPNVNLELTKWNNQTIV